MKLRTKLLPVIAGPLLLVVTVGGFFSARSETGALAKG